MFKKTTKFNFELVITSHYNLPGALSNSNPGSTTLNRPSKGRQITPRRTHACTHAHEYLHTLETNTLKYLMLTHAYI